MASRLTDHVAALDGSFKSLAELLSRFQNIVVASRIEVAKTKALAGVATTVGGMITLTGRIETDVGAAWIRQGLHEDSRRIHRRIFGRRRPGLERERRRRRREARVDA